MPMYLFMQLVRQVLSWGEVEEPGFWMQASKQFSLIRFYEKVSSIRSEKTGEKPLQPKLVTYINQSTSIGHGLLLLQLLENGSLDLRGGRRGGG